MRTLLTVLTIVLSSITFGQEINWLTLDQATKASKENPLKPILLNRIVMNLWINPFLKT